jgi:hypothetical protein
MKEHKNNNEFEHPDRMYRVRRGGRPPLITSFYADQFALNDDRWRKLRSSWEYQDESNTQNNLLKEYSNDLKQLLAKYINEHKLNILSNKQMDFFIHKFFEEIHKKYNNTTYRSKL